MKNHKLPQIDSIQELAQFWDAHDVTDFEEELEEVQEPVFDRGSAIVLQLESDETSALRKIAESEGIDEAGLIMKWVREKIR